MASQTGLYSDIVDITKEYLGPAAERFVTRQIKTHIKKDPNELSVEDIEKLNEWIRVALALLTDDDKLLNDFTKDLMKLAQEKK